MKTKCTPGPWFLDTCSDGSLLIQPREGFSICPVTPREGFDSDIPNFQLMAAAPELTESLRELIDLWTPYLHCVGDRGRGTMIRAGLALAKAEGRT